MKTATVTEVKAHLGDLLKESATRPVVVTRNGKAVAVLVGVRDDDELESLLLSRSPKLRAILDAAERRIDQGEGIPHDDFWRDVEAGDSTRQKNGKSKRRSAKRQC